MRAVCIALVAMLLVGTGIAVAQQRQDSLPPVDSLNTVEVRLRDGSQLIGHVVARDDTSLVVRTASGLSATMPLTAIARWQPVSGQMVRGRFWRSDPNRSRLFFTATGRMLGAGEGYFADYFLFFPFLAFGFHDYFQVAAGVSLLPGIESQVLYFAPKIGLYQSAETNLAIGGIVATVPDEGSVGSLYGALTLGPEDHALTALVGQTFSQGEDGIGLVLGGETRVSGSAKLLGELWRISDVPETPTVFGLRIFGDRLAVDVGLVYVFGGDIEGFPFIPWVDFVLNFGSRPPRRGAEPAGARSRLSCATRSFASSTSGCSVGSDRLHRSMNRP